MSLNTGQSAPDFSLFSDEKQPFTLSSLKGAHPAVLLFFPGAFTSVCTTELNAVSNEKEGYGPETRIFGISTDSPFALSEFRKVNGIRFPLLSDHDAEVSALYGAKYDYDFTPMKLDRISKRAAFVIDRDGVVRYAEVLESAGDMPNLERVREVVSTL